MYIDENEISRIFNKRNWTIAGNYHRKGIIDQIHIEHDDHQHCYYVKADTDTFGYCNHVDMILMESGIIESYQCECPYCNEEAACGHVGAVLLFLNEISPSSFPYHYDIATQREQELRDWAKQQQLQKAQMFLDKYKRLSEGEFQANLMSQKVSLLANLECDHHGLRLGYKIGVDKYYVVKNINLLIQNIELKESVSYGKNLTFTHHIDAFTPAAKETIQFLSEYCKKHRAELEYGYYDKRYLSLDYKTIDAFYDFYSEEGAGTINCDFASEEIETIPLRIKHDGNDYVITTSLDFDTLYQGERYWYKVLGKTFTRYAKDIHTLCSPMLLQLEQDRQIVIPKQQMKEFCSYVYETMKDLITLSGDSIEEYLDEEVYMECYVDMEEHGEVSIKASYQKPGKAKQSLLTEKKEHSLSLDRCYQLINTYADLIDYDAHIAYISDEGKQLGFLKEGLGYLDKLAEVFVSDAVTQLNSPKKVNFQIGIHMENNLLDIDISSVHIPPEELFAVMKSYRRKKKYHRLKNGELLYLEQEAFEEVDEFMEDLHIHASDMQNGKLSLPSFHSFEIDDMAETSSHIELKRSDSFLHALSGMKNIKADSFTLPEGYDKILRDYQVFGYQWLKTMSSYGFGGILADDMGLGKTLQMIALLESEKVTCPDKVSLIVTPASLILNWQDEIHKFSTTLNCLCIHGTTAQRHLQIKDIAQHDVIVTSYDYLRRDVELYQNLSFHYLVLDEAQYIKNHTTKNANVVKALQAEHRFALTGTPIENSLAELWSIFDFLMPNYLYNYHYFRKTYEREIVRYHNEEVSKKLKRLVEPFILRRIKKDVLTELPDKIEQVHYLEFEEEEEKLYLANALSISKELQAKMNVEPVDKFQLLAMMTRLRQLCCDPRLIYENIETPSSKLQGCMDLLHSARAAGKKVLLFSSFTSLLDLIEQELVKEDFRYVMLTGETSKEKRRAHVDTFQTQPIDVFLISLKAGGTGLNLTAAEIVIHFDPWWNMSAQNQATDRAYRIGQTNNVQVYKLIMKNTIEEKIVKMQEKKMALSDTFTAGSEGSITSMDQQEILSLFQP